MTTTQISEATILHFCRFFMLNLPVNLTCFKGSQGALQTSCLYVVVIRFKARLEQDNLGKDPSRSLSVWLPVCLCPTMLSQGWCKGYIL